MYHVLAVKQAAEGVDQILGLGFQLLVSRCAFCFCGNPQIFYVPCLPSAMVFGQRQIKGIQRSALLSSWEVEARRLEMLLI